jgi:hypothetical protein
MCQQRQTAWCYWHRDFKGGVHQSWRTTQWWTHHALRYDAGTQCCFILKYRRSCGRGQVKPKAPEKVFRERDMYTRTRRNKILNELPLSEEEYAVLMTYLAAMHAPLMRGLPQAKVQAMNDGGMGSIRFVGKDPDHRKFGKIVREATFKDTDGVPVLATVIVDQSGALYELDLWKVDFAPLNRIPDPAQLLLDPPIPRISN